MRGLNTTVSWPAISAMCMSRISSRDFPENMGPQITARLPFFTMRVLPEGLARGEPGSVGTDYRAAAPRHGGHVGQLTTKTFCRRRAAPSETTRAVRYSRRPGGGWQRGSPRHPPGAAPDG